MTTHERPAASDDHGFSLIEILIVIVVLGILATVVVFSVKGITGRGDQASCDEDARIVRTSVEAYFAQTGSTSIAVSDPAVPGVSGPTAEDTLVERGLMSAPSTRYDVAADGSLSVAAGSNC